MPIIEPEYVSRLSPEIIELILTTLGNSHDEDPAIQWTQDRHLSAHQLHRLEGYFYHHWLSRFCITIYLNHWAAIDYHFQPCNPITGQHVPPACVRFKRKKCLQRSQLTTNSEVKASWDRYDPWNPHVHLSLGGQLLDTSNHPAHLPMVNDSEIADLCVSSDAEYLTFNWRRTFTAFFKEELCTRRKRNELVRDGWPLATNYAYFAFQHGRIRDRMWSGMM